MNTHRSALSALILAVTLTLSLSACVIEPARVRVGGEFVLTEPPAPLVEERGALPGPGYVWIDGYWNWAGSRHVWVPGRWEAGRPGYRWVPHTWVRGERGWQLRQGHWERQRR